MLKAITIENFKSFGKKQSLPLAPLTLMIGANASGKSNAIEAFRFLSFLAEGQKLSAIQHNIDDSNQIFRGNSWELGHDGADQFTLGCEVDDSVYQISLGNSDREPRIIREHLVSEQSSVPCFETRIHKHAFRDQELKNILEGFFKAGTHKDDVIRVLTSNQLAVLGSIHNFITFFDNQDSDHYPTLITIKTVQIYLNENLFIDPIPSKMRGDSAPEKTLRNNCSNLAGVLQVLCEDEGKKAALLQIIQSLPEQNFIDIVIEDDRRGRYFFKLIETFGGKERSCLGELLSDGTLRVLAIAAALLSAPEGSTVVIEEVDNGIHPSRAHQLLSLMLEKAKERNIRLLLSTHNPALMDALPDEALGDVVFNYRDPEDGDSRLVRLSDLEDYEGLVLQGPLGTLVKNGIVDRFVKNPVSEEERKQKALQWLERMKEAGE